MGRGPVARELLRALHFSRDGMAIMQILVLNSRMTSRDKLYNVMLNPG